MRKVRARMTVARARWTIASLCVECTRGLVENEDGRIFEQRARDRQPLLLSARQVDAPLSDASGKPELRNEEIESGPGSPRVARWIGGCTSGWVWRRTSKISTARAGLMPLARRHSLVRSVGA